MKIMKRILVTSDTHGRWLNLHSVIKAMHDADEIIHLGDGEGDADRCMDSMVGRRITCIAGNCDIRPSCPEVRLLTIGEKRIFCTHGHNYSVKLGLDRLVYAAMEQRADVCLFGHTHVAECFCCEGIHFMNPGSLGVQRDGRLTYGVVDITDSGIVCSIREYLGSR